MKPEDIAPHSRPPAAPDITDQFDATFRRPAILDLPTGFS